VYNIEGVTTFLEKTVTVESYPIAICGICDRDRKQESQDKLLELTKIKFNGLKDPFFIDYQLAERVRNISPSYIKALGVSIDIDGVHQSTGGIIGSPRADISSSNEDIECVGEGLVVVSIPGGPGFIAGSDEDTARKIYEESMLEDRSGTDRMMRVLSNIIKYHVGLAIIVTDGCGPDSRGSAATVENGRICVRTL
jgi:hypothetical protein